MQYPKQLLPHSNVQVAWKQSMEASFLEAQGCAGGTDSVCLRHLEDYHYPNINKEWSNSKEESSAEIKPVRYLAFSIFLGNVPHLSQPFSFNPSHQHSWLMG